MTSPKLAAALAATLCGTSLAVWGVRYEVNAGRGWTTAETIDVSTSPLTLDFRISVYHDGQMQLPTSAGPQTAVAPMRLCNSQKITNFGAPGSGDSLVSFRVTVSHSNPMAIAKSQAGPDMILGTPNDVHSFASNLSYAMSPPYALGVIGDGEGAPNTVRCLLAPIIAEAESLALADAILPILAGFQATPARPNGLLLLDPDTGQPDPRIRALAEGYGLRAALAAGADWVLVLNNDARVEPGTIDELVAGKEYYEIELAADTLQPAIWNALPITGDRLPGGQRIELHATTLRIGSADSTIVQPLIDRLRACGMVIRRIEPIRPSLEDLFMAAVPTGAPIR